MHDLDSLGGLGNWPGAKVILFPYMFMLHIKLNRNEASNKMQANTLPIHNNYPQPL